MSFGHFKQASIISITISTLLKNSGTIQEVLSMRKIVAKRGISHEAFPSKTGQVQTCLFLETSRIVIHGKLQMIWIRNGKVLNKDR